MCVVRVAVEGNVTECLIAFEDCTEPIKREISGLSPDEILTKMRKKDLSKPCRYGDEYHALINSKQ